MASLSSKQEFAHFEDKAENFIPEGFYREIYDTLYNGESIGALYSEVDDERAAILNEIINYNFVEGDNEEKFESCMTELKIAALTAKKERLQKLWQETKEESILMQIDKCVKIINQMKNKGGR